MAKNFIKYLFLLAFILLRNTDCTASEAYGNTKEQSFSADNHSTAVTAQVRSIKPAPSTNTRENLYTEELSEEETEEEDSDELLTHLFDLIPPFFNHFFLNSNQQIVIQPGYIPRNITANPQSRTILFQIFLI